MFKSPIKKLRFEFGSRFERKQFRPVSKRNESDDERAYRETVVEIRRYGSKVVGNRWFSVLELLCKRKERFGDRNQVINLKKIP